MNTGENVQALRAILDMMRLGSIIVLLLHFYVYCFDCIQLFGLETEIGNRLIYNISQLSFMDGVYIQKLSALLLLGISMIGVQGKKDEKINPMAWIFVVIIGLFVYFISTLFINNPSAGITVQQAYIGITSLGFIAILTGGTRLTRYLRLKYNDDIFNEKNETFHQCEELIETEYSVNFPAKYYLKGKQKKSFINLISVFRSTIILGSPGSGKTYFIFSEVIRQHIQKGFCMFLFDFKYPDLTKIAYNFLLAYHQNYKVTPQFCIINFDDLNRTHRCNAIPPKKMQDITDAAESSRTFLLALNPEWGRKNGDFFVESAVNFVTALMWFLRQYNDGKYCTLPHLIELSQIEYQKLFAVLMTESQITVLINPFISALKQKANEQLEGQIASAKIAISRLASPALYYVLSGDDFSLDVNDPQQPKIVCAGSNPDKQQIYSAVLSLYVERMMKLINQKGKEKCSLVFDEFPTIYVPNLGNFRPLVEATG